MDGFQQFANPMTEKEILKELIRIKKYDPYKELAQKIHAAGITLEQLNKMIQSDFSGNNGFGHNSPSSNRLFNDLRDIELGLS